MTNPIPNRRTGGRILVDQLVAQGCDRIFTVPGESFLAVLDALHDTPEIDLVVCRQEGGVGFMACADGALKSSARRRTLLQPDIEATVFDNIDTPYATPMQRDPAASHGGARSCMHAMQGWPTAKQRADLADYRAQLEIGRGETEAGVIDALRAVHLATDAKDRFYAELSR